MLVFPPPVEIGHNEGFTPAKDIFGRAELGKGLTSFVGNVSDPLVIALDAQWGSGKTTFLKMWAGDLRNVGFPVIYFDAFENDYFEDAFLAIAGEIIALADTKRQADSPRGQEFLRKAKDVGKVLARNGLRLAVKGATLGAVDTADLGDAGDELIKAVGAEAEQLLDEHIGSLLTRQREQKDAIEKFRTALSDLPALLMSADEAGEEKNRGGAKPLIFIVDELDRCRPSFALQVLERIKHFFAVPNVHFVLGTHLGQLHNSIITAYGANIDAETYLQKFIHLTVPLVETSEHPNQRTTAKYIQHLAQVMQLKGEGLDAIIAALTFVAHHRELSLRTIERIMSAIAISLAFAPPRFIRPPLILAGLCILKVTDLPLFIRAKQGNLTYQDVIHPLALKMGRGEPGNFNSERFDDFWRYCLDPNAPPEFLQDWHGTFANHMIERERVVPAVAEGIVGRLSPIDRGGT